MMFQGMAGRPDGEESLRPLVVLGTPGDRRLDLFAAAAARLGCAQARIDAGGSAALTDDMFAIIQDGYKDLMERAARLGIVGRGC